MSKRRSNLWSNESLEFKSISQSNPNPKVEPTTLIETENESLYLDEAHEALSKLFNKTNKRAKQLRGVRRKDAWQ